MIQHHLIYYFTSLEDNNTYYESNPHAAYYLVRSGKILHLVEDRLGEYAARVMEAILFLGHASVSHLETLPELQSLTPTVPNGVANGNEELQEDDMEAENQPGETNGDHVPERKPAPFHATIKALASHGYLMRVRDAHFQSPGDNLLEAQRTVSSRSDIKALKGKRQQETVASEIQDLVHNRTHADLSQELMVNGLPRGIKRKFGHNASASTNGLENGVSAHQMSNEENRWSEDEDGFDNTPMEVRFLLPSISHI